MPTMIMTVWPIASALSLRQWQSDRVDGSGLASALTAMSAGDPARAFRLYAWNTALCEALYGSLQGLEITLRNKIHDRLAVEIAADWYDNAGVGLRHAQVEQIQCAKTTLRRLGKPLEPSRVVGELSFGFWVGLLSSKYENSLWRPHLRGVFVNAPSRFVRRDAHLPLEAIRLLRNRIAHHKPILQRTLANEHGQILSVLGWLCSSTAKWVAHHSRFAEVHAAEPR